MGGFLRVGGGCGGGGEGFGGGFFWGGGGSGGDEVGGFGEKSRPPVSGKKGASNAEKSRGLKGGTKKKKNRGCVLDIGECFSSIGEKGKGSFDVVFWEGGDLQRGVFAGGRNGRCVGGRLTVQGEKSPF